MGSSRSVHARRKLGVLFMLVGLLTGTLSVFGPTASAAPVPGDPTGAITGFEVEGNQAYDGHALDWELLAGEESLTVITDDTIDTGLQGSSKENDPSGWECNTGGANPPKNNILHAAINTRVGEAGAFLDLAYMRDGQTGNAHVNFEFNQNPITNQCPMVGRTTGDLLLLFNFPGGAGQADIAAFLWDSTISSDGEWVSTGIPANSAAAVSNGGSTADFIFPGVTTMENRQFGEASLNLTAILGSGQDDCVSFGTVNVRSRSASGQTGDEDSNSINSALQDRLVPTPIDLSTCGRIVLEKTDDAGAPLAGATFGLFETEEDAIAETDAIDTCVTDDDGVCTFDEVDPGSYFVSEISAPAGYDEDPTVMAVEVAALETVEIEYVFVDPRHTGFVEVTKVVTGDGADEVDASELADLRFFLTTNPGDVVVNTWPPPGDTADCSLDGSSYSCVIGPVVLGTYWVNEDPATLPDGLTAGPKVPVTVDQDGETVDVGYTNTINPIDITLEKAGPDTANVGDEITYTFGVTTTGEPLTNLVLTELVEDDIYADRCDTLLSGPTKTGGDLDEWLEVDETWTWSCDHTVTLADATDQFDEELLQNKAEVTGEDSFGREVSDDDPHIVTILLPDVVVEKTPDDGVILPGDDAEFSIVVSNDGPGRANDVVLTDTLPAGIAWEVVDDDGATCGITLGVLTCDIGDLAAGDYVTITVSGPTDIADCGLLENTASATASNELDEDEANNSDDGLITVSCADVTVEKTAADDVISAGEDASFSIVVTNLSVTASATDVELSDPLPDGVDWVLGDADDEGACDITGTGDDQVLTCDFGTVEASGTRTVTVSGTTDPADCGTLLNEATVSSSNEASGADDDNEDDATITVQCPDLVISKTTTTPLVTAGDPINFTITVTNNGPGTAFGVTLNDPLPTGSGISWSETSAACSISEADVLSCSFGDLADDASASVTLTSNTTEASCKSYPNTATADATNDDPVNDSETVVVQCPDLGITKVADDDVVSAGDEIGFTIVVSNDGPGVAKAVTLNDPLPAGDGVDWSIDPAVTGCTITGAVGSEVLSCTFGDLASGATRTIHVVSDTNPTTEECVSGVLNNTATADASNDAPVQAADSVTVECPDLQITKVAADASVSAGEDIGFTITVTNDGPGIAYGVSLSDDMPDGVDWELDSSTAGAGCALSAADVLTCGPVDLDEGESFTATLSAATTEDDCAEYDNTAFADAANDGQVQASDDTVVMCPGLNILKDADDEPVNAGDQVGFTISVANVDGEDVGTAFGVTLNDPLPAGDGVEWSIDDEDGVDASCAITGDIGEQVLSCGPVDLAPGEGFSVHVTSDTDPSGAECVSGTLPNTATADASNHALLTASDTITIQCPDLSITKVADADVVDAGEDIGFTITVTNAGPGTAYGVEISDPLPSGAGVSWSLDAGTEGCLLVGGILGCDVGDLAAGESFSVHVTGETPGGVGNPDLPEACKVYDNTATVRLDNDATETASDATEVICPLEITLEKDGPDLAHRGDEITYEFTVTNSGEADLTTVVLTDPICDEGTLTLVDDADGDTTLAVDEVWTYSCTRVITATDPDPLPNTATVVGTDVRERTTDDTDDHLVDLIAPLIQVVKTVDDETPAVGQTVTYTYVVTNTGDTTLFDILVVDDILGTIGTIDELAPGASANLTTTMVVAASSPTRNIATATGEDVLGKTVTDDDDATITVVLGAVIVPQTPPAPVVQPQALPRTGADSQRLLIMSGVLLLLGGVLLASGQGMAPRHAGRRRQG